MNEGKQQISVVSTQKKFYEIYVQLIDIMYGLKLTKKQLEILAYLLHLYNEYSKLNLDNDSIWNLILSIDNRKAIHEELVINAGSFNNSLSAFRRIKGRQGVLMIDNHINDMYLYKLNSGDENNINFFGIKFMIKDGNSRTESIV